MDVFYFKHNPIETQNQTHTDTETYKE